MKKYIYVIIAVVLVGVVSVGVVIARKDDQKLVDDNTKTEDKHQEEKVTLSDSELQDYLLYVPKYIMDDNEEGVYYHPNNLEALSKKNLLGAAVYYANYYAKVGTNHTGDDTNLVWDKEYNKEDIEKFLSKLYNQPLVELKDSADDSFVLYGCISEYYHNNKFYSGPGCVIDTIHLSVVDKYTATKDELVIYEYAAYVTWEDKQDDIDYYIFDYKNGKKLKVEMPSDGALLDDKKVNIAKENLREHKAEFTKYKHTFKKNDTGYYWYKTEIA